MYSLIAMRCISQPRVVSAAARIREILEFTGLPQENLSQSGVMSANILANVANLLDLKDTETTRFVIYSHPKYCAGNFCPALREELNVSMVHMLHH